MDFHSCLFRIGDSDLKAVGCPIIGGPMWEAPYIPLSPIYPISPLYNPKPYIAPVELLYRYIYIYIPCYEATGLWRWEFGASWSLTGVQRRIQP